MSHAVVMLLGSAAAQIDHIRHLLDARTIVVLAPSAEVLGRWLGDLRATPQLPAGTLTVSDLQVERAAHRVRWRDQVLPLTDQEFRLIDALAEEPGRALSFRELLANVWNIGAHGDASIVRAAVKRLRRKLADAGASVRIEAVRGVGFRLDA